MTALLPARRRAEDFARTLDGSAPADVAEQYAALVATVAVLEREAEPDRRPVMRADFSTELRTRLLAAADEHLVAASDEQRLALPSRATRAPRSRERRLATAAATLVIMGGTAGMAAAAQGADPGDALYPIKRGIEQAQVGLSTSDAGRGSDYLGQASTRLSELRDLVGQGGSGSPADAQQVESTLAAYNTAAAKGADLLFTSYQSSSDPAAIARVRDFATRSMATLASLRGLAPAGTASSFGSAADTVAGIDQQAQTLCGACGGSNALAVPGSLSTTTSPLTFQRLLSEPGAPLPAAQSPSTVDPSLTKAAEEAAKASEIASQFPHTTGSGSTTPGSGTSLPGAVGSTPSKSVQNLVTTLTEGGKQITDPVTSTVTSTVTKAGQTVKTKVTDPLTQGLTNGLGGLLNPPTGP